MLPDVWAAVCMCGKALLIMVSRILSCVGVLLQVDPVYFPTLVTLFLKTSTSLLAFPVETCTYGLIRCLSRAI